MLSTNRVVFPLRRYAAILAGSAIMAGGAVAAPASAAGLTEITVLSTRADLVSGGDALVDIALPSGTNPATVTVTLNGSNVTSAFAVRPNGRYQGVVSTLNNGANQLVARLPDGSGAQLAITNHPAQGPLFAGPQAIPFICRTADFGLGPPTGPGCAAPTRYDFFYRSTVSGGFETFNPASPPPAAQVATTTTDEGLTVPYIARRERGVINRGIHDIAVLFQPGAAWQPWAPQAAWNGKLHYVFRGACDAWHKQNGTVDVLNPPEVPLGDLPLSRGFAVATSALNNCNDLVAAETLSMVKERFIEAYGPVRYTTSVGCSGGSAMEQAVANNYPGLVNGIITACSIPDVWSLISREEVECPLLVRAFNASPWFWTDPGQRGAVSGMTNNVVCQQWADADAIAGAGWFFDPTRGCTVGPLEIGFEPSWVYHPQFNPGGVRCTVQDWQKAAFGTRAPGVWGPQEQQINRGFAEWVFDNEGVQYGLVPLLAGQISREQFVELNVKIGGRDIDYNWRAQRSKATTNGLRNLYRSGRVNDYQRLDRAPIMDVRAYNGDNEGHRSVHGQMTRARLIAANGHAGNQVMWVNQALGTLDQEMVRQAFLTLDQWLAAIEADTSGTPLETKVLQHKPAQAHDSCWANGQIDACGTGVPYTANPTIQAGGPLANNIFKCQRKPINWADYGPVQFTDAQKQALQATFPTGVCDWTKPGVEQQPPQDAWLTFASQVGGAPLGPEPHSTPL